MSIPYELIVAEDLRIGQEANTVNVTMPGGGTATGTPLSLATFRDAVGYTYATLPAASTRTGGLYVVTDSTTKTPGASVAGGGSFFILAFSNGTTWVVVTG